jgi:ElaB/YqjD/DUF883 family membrane-anchored ribosome-binding protein
MTSTNVVKLPERSDEAGQNRVSAFVRDHPGLVVAGGVAVGLVAGALLSRGTGRRLAKHAMTIAEIAGTASLALGKDALERAEDAGGELRKQGEALAGRASDGLRKHGDAIAEKAGRLVEPTEEAIDAASEAAQRLLRKAVELAAKLRA